MTELCALVSAKNSCHSRSIAVLLVALYLLPFVHAWQQWNYTANTTDAWREIWGFPNGPRSRRGHTMVLYNSSHIILFGGRDNEVYLPHVPKTYELNNDEGKLEFISYDENPIRSSQSDRESICESHIQCTNLNSTTSGNEELCFRSWEEGLLENDITTKTRTHVEEACGISPSGLYYNDLWSYDLKCFRFDDLPCVHEGWKVLHHGSKYGGCRNEESDIQNGQTQDKERVCDVPSERWGHGAVMIDDSTMVIFGGYSQECEDYCDDLWTFDFKTLEWNNIKVSSETGPGKRRKFSMVGVNFQDRSDGGEILLFGGHRLWHEFLEQKSQHNSVSDIDEYTKGGFLNDLWLLRREQKLDKVHWMWEKLSPKEYCEDKPGTSWNTRNNVSCKPSQPTERSGHAAVFDKKRNGMWVYGGYSSYYPYPSSSSPGGTNDNTSKRKKGFIPYASRPFFLNDLWFYNFSSGFWKEIDTESNVKPNRRMDHAVVLSDDVLILHGGYSNNNHFNDTWYYFINSKRWVEKTEYVHASYPKSCTDDFEYIQKESCIELKDPLPLRRSERTTDASNSQEIAEFQAQEGYTPDDANPLYFGVRQDAEQFVHRLKVKYLENEVYDENGDRIWIASDVPEGTPIAPYAATGPRQYAKVRHLSFNETVTLEVWEWCVSVQGEPTRGMRLDGKNGRSITSIHIHQPRRRSPGWDGCREMDWMRPSSRSDHVGLYIEEFDMAVFYGGLGYKKPPELYSSALNRTLTTKVLDEFWIYNINGCPKNCSNNGICSYGFCQCDPGYYGLDCSNSTCPGSVCYYDQNYVQHCKHCCYDGYKHSDKSESYVSGIKKKSCEVQANIFTGQSNGICDGFGTCQCAPPFLGDDCSMKDCKNNCSSNGYCSVEFPISRCICNRGYSGDYCQNIDCLNNCSYPNGICDRRTGECQCKERATPNGYWSYWEGQDCSFSTPWCGTSKRNVIWGVLLSALIFFFHI